MDGAVQALAATNPGQVLTSGQEVMRLVPQDGALEVQAYVQNEDIGFVEPGQRAVVKVDSFPFTRFGMLEAEVVSIAHDAIPANIATAAIADATHVGEQGRPEHAPEARPITDLVYEVRLRLAAQTMTANDRVMPLDAGMTVAVEIKTGQRRVLEYLFSPLAEVIGNAGRER